MSEALARFRGHRGQRFLFRCLESSAAGKQLRHRGFPTDSFHHLKVEVAIACPQEEFDQLVDTTHANLRSIIRHNSLVEIRALAARRTTLAGYYDNLLEAAQHAAFLDLEG